MNYLKDITDLVGKYVKELEELYMGYNERQRNVLAGVLIGFMLILSSITMTFATGASMIGCIVTIAVFFIVLWSQTHDKREVTDEDGRVVAYVTAGVLFMAYVNALIWSAYSIIGKVYVWMMDSFGTVDVPTDVPL